ncbi:hypothetical protein DL89DRAFT_103968 [Linderina pennispora]|uniref:Uncharacterized protein n=1 Tax=Linderina pennispora TaxID=61395 RepID=A0A1Y1WEV1_9FUNG|nr:uncharacterized protein DL89DRAFT_103968 [Linderina pennispora]ORX71925.1 hypothetical protein DL89DRAFT_103968 [Linderina pennispora]
MALFPLDSPCYSECQITGNSERGQYPPLTVSIPIIFLHRGYPSAAPRCALVTGRLVGGVFVSAMPKCQATKWHDIPIHLHKRCHLAAMSLLAYPTSASHSCSGENALSPVRHNGRHSASVLATTPLQFMCSLPFKDAYPLFGAVPLSSTAADRAAWRLWRPTLSPNEKPPCFSLVTDDCRISLAQLILHARDSCRQLYCKWSISANSSYPSSLVLTYIWRVCFLDCRTTSAAFGVANICNK